MSHAERSTLALLADLVASARTALSELHAAHPEFQVFPLDDFEHLHATQLEELHPLVTRGEMATFLARALGLEPLSGADFVDIGTSVHRANINALHRAGITAGCDATGDRFCPRDPVTRGQMAAFLVRAGLAG